MVLEPAVVNARREFLAGAAVLCATGPASQAAGAAVQVGVVDVRSCFDPKNYVRIQEVADEAKEIRDRFAKEAADLNAKVAALSKMMDGLSKASELHLERVLQRARHEADLRVLQDALPRKIRELEVRVLNEIRRVVALVARGQKLDLVLQAEEPRLDGVEPMARSVLFHSGAIDVTPQVLAALNAEWKAAWPCPKCARKAAGPQCPDCGAAKP
jgi:Skp family chaperone for outer membrane proteins